MADDIMIRKIDDSGRSFSWALGMVKTRAKVRRRTWKPNKVLILQHEEGYKMAYLALLYDDGRQIPWVPVQCDMLEDDWESVF